MRTFNGGGLSHAYIVTGPSEESRAALAKRLSAAFVCSSDTGTVPCGVCAGCRKAENGNHPDIITVDRDADKREIRVDRIRAVAGDAAVMPNEAKRKVYLINNADTMNPQAQNALLKTLEEPPSHAAFVLLTENTAALLPTVRSRCMLLTEAPEQVSDAPEYGEDAVSFLRAAASGDKMELMRRLFALEKLDKNEFGAFMLSLRHLAAAGLRGEPVCAGVSGRTFAALSRTLDMAFEFLDRNVGTGHIVGFLMAELI